MAATPSSSVIAAWELGIRLRERREQLGLTAAAAGKTTGIGSTNLSPLESGKRRVTAAKLAELAKFYELSAEELDELDTLRGRADRHEWYHDYTTIYSEEFIRFLGLEAGASGIRTCQGEVIPGLLQIADYARANIKGGSPYIRPVEVGTRLESRLARQARLDGDNPVRLSVLISQAALLQEVGGRVVMGRQLEYLAEVIETKPNVDLRVMPFSAGAHPVIGSAFAIFSFDSPRLPDLLWQETVTSQTIVDRRTTLRECTASFDEAMERALSSEDSLELIHRLRKEMA